MRRQLVPVISGMIATEPHGKPWFLPVMMNWYKLKDRLTGTMKQPMCAESVRFRLHVGQFRDGQRLQRRANAIGADRLR